MEKNAFTLIELLAVIVILGVVALITTPIITSSINETKENTYNRQKEMIENAAKTYVNENALSYSGNTAVKISVQTLKNEGYLKKADIKNPKNQANMNGCVTVNRSSKNYTYTYSDSC